MIVSKGEDGKVKENDFMESRLAKDLYFKRCDGAFKNVQGVVLSRDS